MKVDTPDDPNVARIIAFSSWGILRGLETFSQMVYAESDHGGMVSNKSFRLEAPATLQEEDADLIMGPLGTVDNPGGEEERASPFTTA